MAVIITRRSNSPLSNASILPIVYADNGPEASSAISISVQLAKKLSKLSVRMRSMKMEQCLVEVLSELPESSTVKDIDVMFNPNYKIDVLNVLKNACKKKSFSIIWPGRYENGYLYYAEEGYADYKSFNLNNYDITCVVQQ